MLPKDTVLDKKGSWKGIDNVEWYVPVEKIFVNTPYYIGETEVMVFDNPLYAFVIGDLPGARERNDPDSTWKQLEIREVAVMETRAQHRKNKQSTQPLRTPAADSDIVDARIMKEEQEKDGSLAQLHELARHGVSKTIKGNASAFMYRKGLLMRQFSSTKLENGRTFTQPIVPRRFRNQVLRVGHESLMSGHLGTRKSLERIQRQFYWPGIQSDVRRFCRSCDACQRTIPKGKVQRVPLGKMPLIDTPFDRVAVDLIDPLDPVTDRKNHYVLTLVDYATRYPEAVPLQNIDTETVAEALVGIFSRVGVPREILTDMGTQFTSDLMKEVERLLSMKQLVTTPYHPSCNGLVERFNGTLKSMLKKMCAERPRDWDRYVIPLLFAYREVPQESLGFSPFELLYGRTVCGPMSILRELWTEDIPDPEVRTTYQYVLDLKERLQETCKLALSELKKSSARYRTYYNRKAKDRKFAIGEKVLLLLPTQANKLLMQWQGPFEVVGTQGVADYKVQMGDKVKTFHANLLRLYHDRVQAPTEIQKVCAAVIECTEDFVDIKTETYMEPPALKQTETITDVHVTTALDVDQVQEVTTLLQDFKEVMTDLPGRTHTEEINIQLTTTEPVRSNVYSVPYHLRGTVKSELKQMLDMDVIEPSKSAYASPIVLIRKKDNSYRFCTDLRQLNKVTIFDPEPIANTEEIFSRLSRGKFYTKIDLCKGYWQIPVVEKCREMTAFVTPHRLFQWKVMPFGLINAPAVYLYGFTNLV